MNCSQFNTIPLEEVLQILGHLPTKQSDKEAWFLNPFATENHASFKLNKNLNYWYLFSEGIGGSNVDFMKKYLNVSISEILVWAEKQNFSSFHQQKESKEKISPNYKILVVKEEISHPALVQYLQKRNVWEKRDLLKEIHYEIKNSNGEIKKYFAVGFSNNSENSFEISSSIFKGCLGKKDLTLIKNGSNNLKIFESFIDFLSWKIIEKNMGNVTSDYLILNSVSLFQKIQNEFEFYNSYQKIELFLDNDKAGKETVLKFSSLFSQAEDQSFLYENHKDINDFLCSSKHVNHHQDVFACPQILRICCHFNALAFTPEGRKR